MPSLAASAGHKDQRALITHKQDEIADVCLIVEGCYPHRGGGVSVWLDALMRGQPETTFSMIAIQPGEPLPPPIFAPPANLQSLQTLRLGASITTTPRLHDQRLTPDWLAHTLRELAGDDPRFGLTALIDMARSLGPDATRSLPASRLGWDTICRMYEADAPQASFLQYYWAWQALFGVLMQLLVFPLPQARAYHAASSGFAGILAARAAIETGRPMLLTEHGIYANERLAEILSAPWIEETVDRSHLGDDARTGLREIWMRTFEGFARVAYAVASRTITLFPASQTFQRELGADPNRMEVIANGIDPDLYAGIGPAPRTAPPTVALVGRVAPIKDIKTFVKVIAAVRASVPELQAFVLGACDEDPAYADQCRQLSRRLGLDDCLVFTGEVDIPAWLPRLHLCVLTSLSEAQPFSLLEAGAAGIACVATDVGSCPGLVLGEPGDDAALGAGGMVLAPLAVDDIAAAIISLLADHDRREACGASLRARVRSRYRRQAMFAAYRELYARVCGQAGGVTWPA